MEHERLIAAATRLQEVCLAHGITLAVAESLTAGLIGATLAEVPGASRYFVGGVIGYSETVKQMLLRVPQTVLAVQGVVSQECVEAMAHGAQAACGSRAAVAVSGEAGPNASTGASVGTVWIACCVDDHMTSRCEHLEGDRERIRRGTVAVAITLLTETILSHLSGTL